MPTSAAVVTVPAGSARWRVVLGIFKLRIGVMIMLSALAGMAITPGALPGAGAVLVLALSVLVAAGAAGAFNQFFEAESDRLMTRTRGRAFATGALARSGGWLLVIGALLVLAVAAAAWATNAVAALFVFLGAFFYGVVYTVWLKRRTWMNIVVGGLSGSFAVLAGAAAVNPVLSALPLALALVLFLWTPPHFWSLAIACREQYAAAGVPMLPVVIGTPRAALAVHAHAAALVLATLMLPLLGCGPLVLVAALAGGAHLLRRTHALLRRPDRAAAMQAFFASMVQLALLFAAVVLDAAWR
jgi:protoheme IX farnesyltransferase